ncbi:aldehyde dehydrogenase family protein [Patescibacteria group bacterium]|nr:aldehyde dehydrogenase family protein [Patescibacteria group bacterium]
MGKLISTNPANNYSIVGEVTISSAAEIFQKVQKAQAAKKAWKELGVQKRIARLEPICEEFAKRHEELARLITKETGKPIQQSADEAIGYVEDFEWFMEHAPLAIKDEITYEDKNSIHKIVYEPFGVAAVITPWNFPFGMAIWGIVPNLLIGNTVVIKTSEECPLVGKFIEEVFLNHNLPEGVFAEVYGAGEVGRQLSESDVNFIWFTGSTNAGKSLYKTAADKFIKVLLEMGGSNPCVVFEDVDIDKTAEIIYKSRFQNCGQVCDAAKRLIVHESIAGKLAAKLKKILESMRIGDPQDQATDIGSLVAKRQLNLLKEQVDDSFAKGAKIIAQLKLPNNLHGAFYPPTILGNITKDMRVWKEEVFGPVLPMVTFATEDEAIDLANDTPYGLGSKVMSKNNERAERVASKIEAGTVEINEASRWLSCNPFGGYKNSGIGREHGELGFRELCQVKVISKPR